MHPRYNPLLTPSSPLHRRKNEIPLRKKEAPNLQQPPRLPPPPLRIERLHQNPLDLLSLVHPGRINDVVGRGEQAPQERAEEERDDGD